MDFRSLYRSHPTEFAKQSKQSHHLVFMKSNVWSLTQRRQDIDHLFLTQCFQFYLKFRIVYRCMHPPCLNFILCSSSFADVINAVLYPMLQIYIIFLKKQTSQSPRRLVAYLLIRRIICCPELKNLQNVSELKQAYYLVLIPNFLKLALLIDYTSNILLLFN